MARASPIINNFVGGEISPLSEARSDLPYPRQSCRDLKNGFVLPQGGDEERPGTVFVAKSKTADKRVRLIPFEHSIDVKYILEFGEQYIRVYRDHEQIQSGENPYEVSGSPPYLESELRGIQYRMAGSTMYLVHPNHQWRKLTRTADDNWTLAAVTTTGVDFSAEGDRPSCIDYYGDAIYLGATNNNPNQYWRSKVGDHENFTLGTNPADAFTNKIGTKKNVRIRNLVGKHGMFIGTNIGEYIIPLDSDGIITPASLPSDIQTLYGSKNISAEIVNDAVLFFQKGGKRLREYVYSSEKSGYSAIDLTFFANHIMESGVAEMAVQTEPQTIVWHTSNDGRLITLTRELEVAAWSPHPMLATKTEDGTTPATVESVAVLPSGDDVEDEIWISALRCDPDGKRYIEYFKPRNWGSDQKDCYFVDSGVTWDGGADKDITEYSSAKPIQVSSAGHGFSDGEFVRFSEIEDTDETPLDYTVFTEDDTPDRLTVEKNKITVTDFDRDEVVFVSKDCGTAFFSENFEFTLSAKLEEADEDAIAGIWGLANSIDGIQGIISAGGDCLCVSVKQKSADSKYYIELLEIASGSSYTSEYEIELETDYYLVVERDESEGDYGNLYCYIYSDADRSNLLRALELELHAKIDYRYLFAFQSHEYATGGKSLSGEISDLWGNFKRESLNHLVFKVANSTTNTFDLNNEYDDDVDGFFHKEYVSGGKVQKVTKTVGGLDHLEGQIASALVDGAVHPDREVSAGEIELKGYANKIHAGLEFDAKLRPFPWGHPGKKKKVNSLLVWFYKTCECKVGPDEDHLQPITFRKQSDPMDAPPPLFTGKLEPPGWPDGYSEDADIVVVQDLPLPMTIIALLPEFDQNE
ncbi:MAG: hypothetical protein JXQ30_08725 [Spirochaetes bacterium]|nr:hypothetical protein [Spirochaetota bacterium]